MGGLYREISQIDQAYKQFEETHKIRENIALANPDEEDARVQLAKSLTPTLFPRRVKRISQPEAMKTNAYTAGVEKLNGHDAWAMFKAFAAGDMPKVKALLAKDRRLVNAQFAYQFPIHIRPSETNP